MCEQCMIPQGMDIGDTGMLLFYGNPVPLPSVCNSAMPVRMRLENEI